MATPVRDAHGVPASTSMESLYIQIIKMLPRNALSRFIGQLSDIELPEAMREFAYTTYANLTGANLDEVELPLRTYPSVNAFFTRQLKPGLRPIAKGERLMVSPVDGRVSAFGRIEDGMMVQTKGRIYEARELLGGQGDVEPYLGGHYITIYLSPKDYHRIHSPLSGHIRGFAYHPGHLFPVNPPSVKQIDRLFCINERVCVYIDGFVPPEASTLGVHDYAGVPLALVMVGATCVGRMSLSFDDLMTNVGEHIGGARSHYHEGRGIESGEEVGRFNLGSTVILLIGESGFEFDGGVVEGAPIRLGEVLGRA